MVAFIIYMTRELQDDGQTPVCGILRDPKNNWDELRTTLAEMRDPSTGMKASDNDNVSFNNQDISDEFGMIMDSFVSSDFKKLGYFLGDTLVKHSTTNQKNLFLY